jgi:hypothetical protein
MIAKNCHFDQTAMNEVPLPLTEVELKLRQEEHLKNVEKWEKEKKERFDQALNAEKIYNKAIELRSWVYDPANKIWYTPEEFLNKYGKYYHGHQYFSQVKLMDPAEGIKAGYKKLDMLEEKLKEFTMRVIKYYSEK